MATLTIVSFQFRVVIARPQREFFGLAKVYAATRSLSLNVAVEHLGANRLSPRLVVQFFQPNLRSRMNRQPILNSGEIQEAEWRNIEQKDDAHIWEAGLLLRPQEYSDPNGIFATITSLVRSLVARTYNLDVLAITMETANHKSKMRLDY